MVQRRHGISRAGPTFVFPHLDPYHLDIEIFQLHDAVKNYYGVNLGLCLPGPS
jgi:hypothetical protein